MPASDTVVALAALYGVRQNSSLKQAVNRSIRTLPGGAELLDAIEAINAARNHAARAGAKDRVIAHDACLDRLEQVRDAMEDHVTAAAARWLEENSTMRNEFVRTEDCESEEQVLERCPWAAVVVQVDGGWRCFESIDDARTWKNQQ